MFEYNTVIHSDGSYGTLVKATASRYFNDQNLMSRLEKLPIHFQKFINQKNNPEIGFSLTDSVISLQGFTQAILYLKNFENLTHLDCYDTTIGDEGASVVATCLEGRKITHLNLYKTGIKSQGMASLAKMLTHSPVEQLNLTDNMLGEAGLFSLAEAIKGHQTLSHLTLAVCKINEKGCQHLANALACNNTLQSLKLWCNPLRDEGGIHIINALKINSSLRHLDMGNSGLSDRTFQKYYNDIHLKRPLDLLNLAFNWNITPDSIDCVEKLIQEGTPCAWSSNASISYGIDLTTTQLLHGLSQNDKYRLNTLNETAGKDLHSPDGHYYSKQISAKRVFLSEMPTHRLISYLQIFTDQVNELAITRIELKGDEGKKALLSITSRKCLTVLRFLGCNLTNH